MIECPHNYFGRGVNFQLPDDPIIIQEIEKKWEEWESAHPDDPTGERAYVEAMKRNGKTISTRPEIPKFVQSKEGPVTFEENKTKKLRLELPKREIELLKRFSAAERRHPRDIIIRWIHQNCKL